MLVGSLRKDSLNLKLAHALTGLAPEGLTFKFVGIADIALYNPDLEEGDFPAPWATFRAQMAAVDGVLL